MVQNLNPNEIYQFIVSDFRGAWDSIAANYNQSIGRGNFMFAFQAMNLLEFASRLCDNDSKLLNNFSNEINRIDPKYFTLLPGPCGLTTEFDLPYIVNNKGDSLLCAFFDLIRNGLGHQYQQIIVDLTNKKHFYVSLSGAERDRYLNVIAKSRSPRHLAYTIDSDGDLGLALCPGDLFLDFEKAIVKSALLHRSLSFQYLSRPKPKSKSKARKPTKYYDFDIRSLEASLVRAKHIKF